MRNAQHQLVSTALAALDDRQLSALLEPATSTARIDVAGVPVFVKRVPLTELERANPLSTANLFELPLFYQYRIGSSGVGAWREVIAHEQTTAWALDGRCPGFPLAYHWRVLDSTPRPFPVEQIAALWGSAVVRVRLEAIARATADVVLFLEYIPHTLHAWLTAQLVHGDEAVAAACAMAEREARSVVEFMRSNELVHFDPHFHNLLTDGEHVYFGDLGLASSRRFELSVVETEFLARHAIYDECVVALELVDWLAEAYPDAAPPFAVAIRERLGPVATLMTTFYTRLRADKLTPFPVEELLAVLAR